MQIFLAFGRSVWEVVLPEAFKPFGDVTVFDWASWGFGPNRPDWWERRPVINREMLAAFHETHSRRPVDAVVGYLSGFVVDPSVLAQMARAGAAIFNFSYDEKLGIGSPLPDGTILGPAALASVVDLNLTNEPGPALKYTLRGGLAHFHPEAADSLVHRPYDVPFRYDVTFIGARYGFRPYFIQRLRNMGINVTAFGRDWPNGPLPLERWSRCIP
jgi:spore maturation protein CgeB